ncbi:transglutaminase family protein [Salibacterium aidingense]|uniref:transglutaminase family protein n=1 Tax=Salibacterium aidingense TaxID=384933 RepID=UPI0003F5738F|nr:transglutaminase domain-containing protein [Salibacterium aidingense]
MQTSPQTPKLFLMYMLGYLLLMEWLIPLPEITQTGYVPVFMAASGFFFLVMFFQFPWWASLLLIGGGLLFGIHTIFIEHTFLSLQWWGAFLAEINMNLTHMFQGEWYGLSDLFRSLLFLMLLGIMSYLIYFWIVHARRILFFFLFTVLYVGVIDTFFPYDGSSAIVRIFILGFVLMALLQWDRLSGYFPGAVKHKYVWLRWTVLAVIFLIAAAGVGMLAPKAEPQWPDPLPYMEAAAGIEGTSGIGNETVRKIGYGDNDEQLGGGFEMDETPVFTASGGEVGYWRGDSKNVYTGQGWTSDTPDESRPESDFFDEAVPVEEQEVDVEIADSHAFDFAFYPGSIKDIQVPEEDVRLQVDRYSGKAAAVADGDPYEASSYSLTYAYPEFPIDAMQQRSPQDPEEVTNHYLGLPEDLPTSIGELAEDITAEEENRYDKVRAVERFLNSPEFTYDTSNIAVPEEGEDYVEQFLFDTKRGYCDNFSTSMAVMLRTLDIPTRWVKGFTKGNETRVDQEETVYEVTSANAHSWVEVYFPDVGWVPFEPTRGFTSEFDYTYAAEESGNNEETAGQTEEETEEEEEEAEEEETEEQEEDSEASAAGFSLPGWPIYLSGAIVFLGIAYMLRFPLIKRAMIFRFRHVRDPAAFTKAFLSLLTFLRYAGFGRKNGETLREYGMRMDEVFETEEMSTLVYEYEKIHYGALKEDGNWSNALSIWMNMVNRIKA